MLENNKSEVNKCENNKCENKCENNKCENKCENNKCENNKSEVNKSGVNNENILSIANAHDRCNYLARYGYANFQIQTILILDGCVDFNRLCKAFRLAVEYEPVFGCRFIESDPPYWKKREDFLNTDYCILCETEKPDKVIWDFLSLPLDMDNDPMVKAMLVRSAGKDTLVIKVNHTCCDGSGAKEFTKLINEIYNQSAKFSNLESGTFAFEEAVHEKSKDFSPPVRPRIAGRKDQDRLLNVIDFKNPFLYLNHLLYAPQTAWFINYRRKTSGKCRYVISSLSRHETKRVREYAKARNSTVNDMLLTAYYRALFKLTNPPFGVPMDITSTIDLRKYLPDGKANAIRNFSGGFLTRLPRLPYEGFDATLSRVSALMSVVKETSPGLQNAISGEILELLPFSQLVSYSSTMSLLSDAASFVNPMAALLMCPGLSNLVFLSPEPFYFDQVQVPKAYMLPPVVTAPGFLVLAGTYNGELSLSAGYNERAMAVKDIKCILEGMKKELTENV